ncbi:ATP-binding protein [Pacificimonas sp. ICDLI1SI03]
MSRALLYPVIAASVSSAVPASALAALPENFQVTGPTSAALIVAAAWLLIAVWAVIRSARIRAQAETAQAWGLRLRGLLSTLPVAYLISGDGGRVTASDSLRSWLGIDHRVTKLSELAPAQRDARRATGLDSESYAALGAAIAAAAVSGQPFVLRMKTADGARRLQATGRAAPPEVAGDRGVTVWFADTTETDRQRNEAEARSAEQLARSEAALAILAVAPVPVWRRAADLRLVQVNEAYGRAVEAESPDAAVAEQAELLTGSLSMTPKAAAQAALEEGSVQVREETTVIGGERRRLRIAEMPLPSGEVAGLALDITEREEARAERDRFAEAQSYMVARLSAGVAQFNAERQLVTANAAFQRIFRIDDDMLEKKPEFGRVLERMREARRLPEQRDFPNWMAERRGWFLSADAGIEETWVLPDNMVLRVLAQPAPDGGLLLIFEDQSERLRLASSRDQLIRVQDATLQNLQEALAVFGVNGRLQFHNRAFRDLWDVPEKLLSENPHVDALFQESQIGVVEGEVAEIMRELINLSTDGRIERSGRLELTDGRYLRFAAVPLPDGNALFTFIDVTDAERIELALRDRNEALEAADAAKSRFVESMSYELRTPLTAIAGFAELLELGIAGELKQKQADYVASIRTSAERLRVMINGIIDLAVSDAEGLALDSEDVDIRALIDSVAAMSASNAADRGVEFSVKQQDDLGSVLGDSVRLQQAVYNLVSNALRFTPQGGHVGISAKGDADGVQISVRDTGIGIPEEEHEAIFERFRKGSNAGASQGVGLGLSLVREIVTLHGGTLMLKSAPGEGTEISMHLPRRMELPPVTRPIVTGGII